MGKRTSKKTSPPAWQPFTIRLLPEEWDRFTQLVARVPVASMARLGRAVFLAGLAQAEADPVALVVAPKGRSPEGGRRR